MTLHSRPPLPPRLAVPPSVHVSHPALTALLARWHAYAGRRPMPERDDLGFLNLKPWHGHLLLVEVIDHGRQFRVAPGTGGLADPGDAVAAAVGARAVLDDIYGRAVAHRSPAAATIESRLRSGGAAVEVLALPLAGADGLVAALLVGAYERPAQALAEDADQGRDSQD